MDDPAGEVVAALRYPRFVQSLARVSVGLGVVAAAGLVQWRVPYVPVLALVLAFPTNALPQEYRMVPGQIWGSPWEAARIRWAALALFAVSALALGLRDLLSGRVEPRRIHRRDRTLAATSMELRCHLERSGAC